MTPAEALRLQSNGGPTEHDIGSTHRELELHVLAAARTLLRHPFARKRAPVEYLRAAMAKLDGYETQAEIPTPKARLK